MRTADRPQTPAGKRLLPHDVVDLRLAPVALHVDGRLEEMSRLDDAALRLRVAYDTDRHGQTREQRARDVVDSACHLLDLGGWQPSWDERGLRLSHGEHSVVLGVPANVRAYVEGEAGA